LLRKYDFNNIIFDDSYTVKGRCPMTTQTTKPYQQGFNESTGDVIFVISPEDIQESLKNGGRIVTIEQARDIAEEYGDRIINAFLNNDWQFIIQLATE